MHPADGSAAPEDAPPRLLPPRPPTSPLAWLVTAALLLLALSFYSVVAAARRSARTEGRGDGLADELLRIGCDVAPIDWQAEWLRQHVLARLVAAGAAHGVFVADLELLPPRSPTSITFANKHFVVELRSSTAADPEAAGDGDLPLEAVAWPKDALSPAHTAFFHPEDEAPAWSRNLHSAFSDRDAESRPAPGQCHRRDDGSTRLWDYRGADGERWLLVDRPPVGGLPARP